MYLLVTARPHSLSCGQNGVSCAIWELTTSNARVDVIGNFDDWMLHAGCGLGSCSSEVENSNFADARTSMDLAPVR